jgi:hypothetical protein
VTQDVDPETFYRVGRLLSGLSGSLYRVFGTTVTRLAGTASMAGSDGDGRAWAASYDARARDILDGVNDLTAAMDNYAGVMFQAGFNHAIAEYNSGSGGAPPVKPAEPASTAGVVMAPPSAGGPGEGLVDSALGLVEQIGIPVPDGDTAKLESAATTWSTLATVMHTTGTVALLGSAAQAFADTKTAEVDLIANDLTELHGALEAILAACTELGRACTDYRKALDDLRTELSNLLKDLASEIAATAVIGVAASFISFGATVAVAAAKAAHSITKFAGLIRTAVSAWKISKAIRNGVKTLTELTRVRARLQRIKNLGRKGKREEPVPLDPKFDAAYDFNIRPERLEHTFHPKHNLDGVVNRLGGREQAIRAMLDALRGNVPTHGQFERIVTISGEQVTVRGFVDGGVIKIGTAFIP